MQRTIERVAAHKMESAYVMINCTLGSESSIISQLKSIPGVTEVQGVFGNYDILAKIDVPSVEYLREMIALRIRKIPEISSTTTIICSKLLA